ncbi:MAG: hypothetical protein ACREM3_07425 [Candidatus Rokuibacteriota bacterium]
MAPSRACPPPSSPPSPTASPPSPDPGDPDGFFPGAPDLIAKRPELPAETKRQILAGGAIYGLR